MSSSRASESGISQSDTGCRLDVSEVEGKIPREYGQDAVEVPGSRNLLETLERECAPWMIVTSGTRALVDGTEPLSRK